MTRAKYVVSNAVPSPPVTFTRPSFNPSTLSALLRTESKEPTACDIPMTVPMNPLMGLPK